MRKSLAPSKALACKKRSLDDVISVAKNAVKSATLASVALNSDSSKVLKKRSCDDVSRSKQAPRFEDDGPFIYFCVTFGKPSTRKHKLWEGDGVIEVNSTDLSATLKDTDGNVVSKGSLRQAELVALQKGEKDYPDLQIGSKVCQIQDRVAKSEYPA